MSFNIVLEAMTQPPKSTPVRGPHRWLSRAGMAADVEDPGALWVKIESIAQAIGKSRTRTLSMFDEQGGRDAVASIQHRGGIWFNAQDTATWLSGLLPGFGPAGKARLFAGARTAHEITNKPKGKIQ